MKKFFRISIAIIASCLAMNSLHAQTDTIRVMAYNVLNYGVYCQGPDSDYHSYLKTILQYANPDIVSLEKMGSIPVYQGDIHDALFFGYQDTIMKYAFDGAFPGRYAYCPFSNDAGANDMSMLFYDQTKFGFVGVTFIYPDVTDFDCYKLYYKDPALVTTHDTTFLYIIPNHDISGSSNVAARGEQIAGYMQKVQNHFSHLPNMITMGDFNLRYTIEPLYQTLTAPTDTNYRFYDPPFYPDGQFSYPANWDSNPAAYTGYLTTSTRALPTQPNSCGTSGGAKNWYDHIFISPWLVNNTNYIQYIPNSYRTLGNDGHRLSISVNDNTSVTNTSAPANVIEAIYQMSNKYPIMADLAITSNTTGTSPVDPEISNNRVTGPAANKGGVNIVNPVADNIVMHFNNTLAGQSVTVTVSDMLGRIHIQKVITVTDNIITIPFDAASGLYCIKITDSDGILNQSVISKP